MAETEPTRIRLNQRPPDCRAGLELVAPNVVVRTVDLRGCVIELETTGAVAGIQELCDLSEPFGGCRIQLDGRFQLTRETVPSAVLPELRPLLEQYVESVSGTIAEILARDARVRDALGAIEDGGDPLDHEGTDWSDIWDD